MATRKLTAQQKADLIGAQPYKRTADTKNTPASKPRRVPGNGLSQTGALATQPRRGGRQIGSKNKKQVSEEMLTDILDVYQRLGGVKFLLKYAKDNPTDFVKTVLARLMPTPYVEPANAPSVVNNLNIHNPDDPAAVREAARQIAFALAQGAELMKPVKTLDAVPAEQSQPVKEPLPAYEPPSAFADNFSLPDLAQKAAAAELVANTFKDNISSYSGSGAEQGNRKKKRL